MEHEGSRISGQAAWMWQPLFQVSLPAVGPDHDFKQPCIGNEAADLIRAGSHRCHYNLLTGVTSSDAHGRNLHHIGWLAVLLPFVKTLQERLTAPSANRSQLER